MSTERQYEVTWGMTFMAENPADALRQALGDLADVVADPSVGPNVFLIRDVEDLPVEENFVVLMADDISVTAEMEV